MGHALSIMMVIIKSTMFHIVELVTVEMGEGFVGAEVADRVELLFIELFELFGWGF